MLQLPSQQDIQVLLTKLNQFKNRKKPLMNLQLGLIQLEHPLTNPDDFIAYIMAQVQSQSSKFDQLIDQYNYMLTIVIQSLREHQTRVDTQASQIQQKNNKIQQLKQIELQLQKQKDNLSKTYVSLMQQFHAYKKETQQFHIQSQKQKLAILQKLQDYQTHSQKNLQVFSSIKQINQTMRQTYNEKSQLQAQLNDLNKKIIEKEKQIGNICHKLEWEVSRRQKFQQIIKHKDFQIKQLEQQIDILRENMRNPYGRMDFDVQMFTPPHDQNIQVEQSVVINNKVKLSQDVEHKSLQNKLQFQMKIIQSKQELNPKLPEKLKPVVLQLSKNMSLSQLNLQKTVSNTPSKYGSKIKKPIMLDPYFCHFILLSQTIKILSNSQTFFTIDMKPYYKQIIAKNIPIYQWKEWLEQKFTQISQSKNSSKNSILDEKNIRRITLNKQKISQNKLLKPKKCF